MTFTPWSVDMNAAAQEAGQPDPTRSEWDTLGLGGKNLPGVVTVDIRVGSGLDIQKPKGGKRARTVDEGDPPIRLKIRIEMTPSEAQQFRDEHLPNLKPRNKRGGREPLEITHPQAEFWGIDVVSIGDIDAPQPRAGGLMEISIDATEWTPEPAPVKTSGNVKSADHSFPIPVSNAYIDAQRAVFEAYPGLADGF